MTAAGPSRWLKVLHVDPERNWGGGEAQVFGLVSYLQKKGHSNHLLTHPDGKLFARSQAAGITTRPLEVTNHIDLRSIPGIRKLIHKEDFDIVHLHTKRAHALSLWLPKGRAHPKYVVTRRMDYQEREGWYSRLLYNRRVDGVVAISRPIVELLVKAGVDREKIRLIHSGIDPNRFQCLTGRSDSTNDGLIVGIVASLEERKGHRFLLEAASTLKKQGCRLRYRLAGEGPLAGQLREMVDGLDLRHEVTFSGFVTDIPNFLSDIDIFVLPSLYEGLGVAAMEAMAAGKPVVASRVGGLAELVVDSVTGLLVSPRSAHELARAILRLIHEKGLAQSMGERAAQRIRENFTLDEMAKKNEAYYYALLGATA